MAQVIEALVILFMVWQLMKRLKGNSISSSQTANDFQEAIDNARDRLPRTGLLKLFKGEIKNHKNEKRSELEIDQSLIPAKGADDSEA